MTITPAHNTLTAVVSADYSFLPARRYASAVLAMGLCLSVCLSVTSGYSIETSAWMKLVFDTQAHLDLSFLYTHCV